PAFCRLIPKVRSKKLVDVSTAESAESVLPSEAERPPPDRAHRPCAKPKGGRLAVRQTMNDGPDAAVTAVSPSLRRHTGVDAGLPHVGQPAFLAALQIEGGRRFLPHADVEARLSRVDRRPGDAIVERQPTEDQPGEAARFEIAVEPGAGHSVVLAERRIGIDPAVEALAHDGFGLVGMEIGMEGRARRALHT